METSIWNKSRTGQGNFSIIYDYTLFTYLSNKSTDQLRNVKTYKDSL